MKLNSQLTTRLVLRNAFKEEDPQLTNDIQFLYNHCPTLFKRALARSDRNELDTQAQAAQDQDDFELEVLPSANETHRDPSIINRVPPKEIRGITHTVQGDAPMPLKAGQMSEFFLAELRLAYHKDYGKPDYWPTAFDKTTPIQYARKLAFNRPALAAG